MTSSIKNSTEELAKFKRQFFYFQEKGVRFVCMKVMYTFL